jgi:tRNA threonylcarbamoyladenosine biosynthesis protein TsaB
MTLGIETSTAVLGIALAHGSRILASVTIARANVHDELLIPMCHDALAMADVKAEAIQAIAVSAGPGSYTGLRIGMAAAKGLCLALSLPLVAVPTCDAAVTTIAAGGIADGTQLAVCIDAKNDHLYFAAYVMRNGRAQQRHPVSFLPVDDAVKRIEAGTLLLGNGALLLETRLQIACRIPEDPHAAFRGDGVALLGEHMATNREFCDISTCEPVYLREFTVRYAKNPTIP